MNLMTTTRGAHRALVPLALAAALALTACGHNRTGDLEDKLLMDPFNDKPFKEDKQLKAAQRAVLSTPVFPISAMNISATSEGKLICMPS